MVIGWPREACISIVGLWIEYSVNWGFFQVLYDPFEVSLMERGRLLHTFSEVVDSVLYIWTRAIREISEVA